MELNDFFCVCSSISGRRHMRLQWYACCATEQSSVLFTGLMNRICAFRTAGDTTAELCARWMELGSFYMFSRNHNAINRISQEPYAFGQPLIDISKNVLRNRYPFLPMLFGTHSSLPLQ